jgi:hypothetical protein
VGGIGRGESPRLGAPRGALFMSVAVLVGACSPAPSPTPTTAPTVSAATASPIPSPSLPAPSPSAVAANPEDCPQPDEAIGYGAFVRYPDDECFPAGVTVDGWWHTDESGAILIGRRPGSVDERARGISAIDVSLRSGAILPAPNGYGRFFTRTITVSNERGLGLADAELSPLPNPAASCPTTTPVPIKVFMDSLVSCWGPGTDVTIAGWRDTLDGLCGCGPMFYFEKPKWLTGQYGFGWLFAEPYALNLDDYFTLYAPDAKALGTDSGDRPTYMEVTGHFGDPAAATCRVVPDPDAPPSEAITDAQARQYTRALRKECAKRLVVTSLEEVPPPSSALSFCPAVDPLTVSAVWDWGVSNALLDQVCYGGGEITMYGWFDADTDAAGEQPSVSPAWLDTYAKPALWSVEGGTWENDLGLELFVDPATNVVLPASRGWYTMTGHFDDPAAGTCVRTDGSNAGNSWVEECRNKFVVSGVARS